MGRIAPVETLIVRPGLAADLPAVGALLAEGFADKFGRIFGRAIERVPALLAGFTSLRQRRGLATVFVAARDEQVVGVLDIAHGREGWRERWEQLQIALREVGARATLRSFLGLALLLEAEDDRCGRAYISELAVAASQRGRGTGTALLGHAADWARVQGRPGLSLHVAQGNPAQRLYTRVGFRVEKRIAPRLERWLFGIPGWLYMVKDF